MRPFNAQIQDSTQLCFRTERYPEFKCVEKQGGISKFPKFLPSYLNFWKYFRYNFDIPFNCLLPEEH